jgi:hypothetical protein
MLKWSIFLVFKYPTVILYLFKEILYIVLNKKIRQNLRSNRIWKMKPTHLKVNYKTLKVILLFEPQQIQFPYNIDLDRLD